LIEQAIEGTWSRGARRRCDGLRRLSQIPRAPADLILSKTHRRVTVTTSGAFIWLSIYIKYKESTLESLLYISRIN
jgi:hypothetical protein